MADEMTPLDLGSMSEQDWTARIEALRSAIDGGYAQAFLEDFDELSARAEAAEAKLAEAEAERDALEGNVARQAGYMLQCDAKLAAAEAREARLRGYVRHRAGCESLFLSLCGDNQRCDCGLAAALKEQL